MSTPADDQLIDDFVHRVLTRDTPPPPPPLPRDRESILTRVAASLLQRYDVRNKRLRRTLAGCCHALLAQPRRSSANLARELGCARQTAAQAAALLIELGLFEAQIEGRHHYYRLSRPGEDWLLPLVAGPITNR